MDYSKKLLEVEHFNYKYLVYIAMLFITLKLTMTMLVYQTITIFNFTASLSIILMPLWFLMMDIITEIYGYKITKKLIIWALVCQFIFTFGCAYIPKLTILGNSVYEENPLFSIIPRVALASLVGSLSGGLLNSYIVEKYKIIFNGKYFIFRSFYATMVGELIYTIITDTVAFIGIKPPSIILQLIITSYILKLITNPIMLIPAVIFSNILGKAENNKIELS